MHARNRTWPLGQSPEERCRQRILPIEGGDGSTLTLDFTTGVLDPRLTFTRSSTATYIGADGLVKTMAAAPTNDPTKARFDHDPTTGSPRGLLIEGAANNIATNSNLQAGWLGGSNTTVTANTNEVTSPDGTNNAAKVALTNTGYCSRFESITGLANATTYTFSYWIRGTAGNQQRVYSVTQGVDLVTQSTLTYTSTGWTRVQITFTSGATSNNVYIYVASRPTGTVNDVLYIWGAQLEVGSGASSHIPTGASTGNRAADVCYMANADYGFSTSGGTYLAEWHRGSNITTGSASNNAFATDYASGRWLGIYTAGASSTGTAGSWAGYLNVSGGAVSGINKMAVSYSSWVAFASGNTSLNGGAIVSGTLTLGTTPTYLFVGAASGTAPYSGGGYRDPLNNCVRRIKYWPSVLPNAQLQSLTTP